MQNTKRAFLISVTSMLLCVALLIGSTFAWFTDSVSTGINTIEAGNLDIEMYFAAGKLDPAGATYTNAANNKIFDYDLWEPGYTVARHIKISNLGNLAAKYAVHFDVAGEVGSLAEVIDVYFIDPAQAVANRTDLATLTPYGTLAQVLNGNAVPGDLEGGKSNIVTIVLKMQESAGNAYKNATVGDLTIHLVATQDTVEADSFGTDYDTNAKVPVPVSSMEDLTKALGQMEENGVVMLTAPLTVTGMTDGDMNGKTGTIDFNGTTATGSNLNIAFRVREGSVGTIQNGTIVAESNTYPPSRRPAARRRMSRIWCCTTLTITATTSSALKIPPSILKTPLFMPIRAVAWNRKVARFT